MKLHKSRYLAWTFEVHRDNCKLACKPVEDTAITTVLGYAVVILHCSEVAMDQSSH
jgi:hypothetical protein